MQTENEIIDNIIAILSREQTVEKIIYFGEYLSNGLPYEVTLIVYETCQPNYIVTTQHYETLLKSISIDIQLNILPVSSCEANRSLDKRLEHLACIYEKKAKVKE